MRPMVLSSEPQESHTSRRSTRGPRGAQFVPSQTSRATGWIPELHAFPRTRLLAFVPWLAVIAMAGLPIGSGAAFQLGLAEDWNVLDQIPARLASGTLYVHDGGYNFVWSPLAAALIVAAILPMGFHAWFVLHAVALAWLRDRQLIALAVCSLPLWIDAGLGNTVAFAFVAGALAMRGSRAAELVYLALFVLIPRPVTLPLVSWLLWHRPQTRMPFLTLAGVVAVTAVGSGYAGEWLGAVTPMTTSHVAGVANVGPTRLIGPLWLLAGVPASIWLAAHSRLGLAGLAITPYLFPQYLLLALWDVVDHAPAARAVTPMANVPSNAPASIPATATVPVLNEDTTAS